MVRLSAVITLGVTVRFVYLYATRSRDQDHRRESGVWLLAFIANVWLTGAAKGIGVPAVFLGIQILVLAALAGREWRRRRVAR